MIQTIQTLLPPGDPWGQHLIWLESVDSTNTYCKELARQGAPEGTAVFAAGQTGGRGRMGRSFSSPAGQGLYFSLLLRPNCLPEKLMHLTCAAGVAASDGIFEACGIRPGIKWTNDLVVGKRKLGGILTEMGIHAATGLVEYAIVGIGINCCQRQEDFPPEIRPIATSLQLISGQAPNMARLAAAMLLHLQKMANGLWVEKASIMDAFSRLCVTIGQEISILRGEDIRHGTAIGVDADGGLQVLFSDGKIDTVTSGEVSIRGMYGYM